MATIYHTYKASATRASLVQLLGGDGPEENVMRLAFKGRNLTRASLVGRLTQVGPNHSQSMRSAFHAAVAYIPPPKVSGNNIPTDFNATFSGG